MQRPISKAAFYRKLRKYLYLSVILFIINIATSPGNWWFLFPVLGMGIGIAARATRVDFNTSSRPSDGSQRLSADVPTEELDLNTPPRQKKWSEKDLV